MPLSWAGRVLILGAGHFFECAQNCLPEAPVQGACSYLLVSVIPQACLCERSCPYSRCGHVKCGVVRMLSLQQVGVSLEGCS